MGEYSIFETLQWPQLLDIVYKKENREVPNLEAWIKNNSTEAGKYTWNWYKFFDDNCKFCSTHPINEDCRLNTTKKTWKILNGYKKTCKEEGE